MEVKMVSPRLVQPTKAARVRPIVERLLVIDDPIEQERLWTLYDEAFRPVNEETPIMQSFPKERFVYFLGCSDVVKFVVRMAGGPVGIGLVTTCLELDPLLSLPYFEKNYAGVPLVYIMAYALSDEARGVTAAKLLLCNMILEAPEGGRGVFAFSKAVNVSLPKLAEVVSGGHIVGQEVDQEGLCVYGWKDGGRTQLQMLIAR